MINYTLHQAESVLHVRPAGPLEIVDSVADHFVAAEIRTFPFGATEAARAWARTARDISPQEEI